MERIKQLWNWIKTHRKTSIAIGIVVVLIIARIFGGDDGPAREFITVEKQDITQSVDVTGQVIAAAQVDLAFERSGKVAQINVEVGDHVEQGHVLAVLNNAGLSAQLQSANASALSAQALVAQYESALLAQQVKLEEVLRGARDEEVTIAQTKVDNALISVQDAQDKLDSVQDKAQSDLDQVYEDMADVLHDAVTKADDALNRLVDSHFSADNTANPELTFVTANLNIGQQAESSRVFATSALSQLKSILATLPTDGAARASALLNAQLHFNVIRDFFTTMTTVMVEARGLDESTLDTYRNNVSTARTNVNTAITTITAQLQLVDTQQATNDNAIAAAQITLSNAQNVLNVAHKDLDLVLAGPTIEQIQAQEAAVAQAQANLDSQKAQLQSAWANAANVRALIGQTVISAPIAGVVTKQDTTVGEIVSANAVVLGVIANTQYEIEAFVPEVDVAKLTVEDEATVTLDAYGSDVEFNAVVSTIDPAETIVDGLATYRIRVQFMQDDERIRSGMTANMEIDTDSREGVIAIPQRAVLREDGKKVVRILRPDESIENVQITTGLRGSDGLIEVLSGVEVGQQVITFLEEEEES